MKVILLLNIFLFSCISKKIEISGCAKELNSKCSLESDSSNSDGVNIDSAPAEVDSPVSNLDSALPQGEVDVVKVSIDPHAIYHKFA